MTRFCSLAMFGIGIGLLSTAMPVEACAGIMVYTATLDGPSEVPPIASPGTGHATLTIDDVAHTMRLEAIFSDLIGTTTASHIHSPTAVPGIGTAGVATQTPTFVGFPLGVTSGVYDATFDMTLASSYNPTFLLANGASPLAAEASLLTGLAEGRAYLNIHSNFAPGGEIRGFFQPAPVPEPSSVLIMGTLGGIALATRARRRKPLQTM